MNWAVYGTSSGFHTYFAPAGTTLKPSAFDPTAMSREDLKGQPKQLTARLRLALLVNGVDVNGRIGGFTSCTHQQADVDATVTAWRSAIRMLRAENEL